MRTIWQRVRSNWNHTDTIVMVCNTAAFLAYWGNCTWESLLVCYVAAAIPLAALIATSIQRKDITLRNGLYFGLGLGIAWPIGEGITVRLVGWWGDYTGGGPMVWDTAAYCMLIGWLATAHIFYVSQRTLEMGFSMPVAAINAGFTAFAMGLIGENFFVASGMWTYREAAWQWWYIPAFLPIAYGLGYAIIPVLRRWSFVPRLAVFLGWLFVTCTGLGLLTGFFPA